jgi:hypothetical protein
MPQLGPPKFVLLLIAILVCCSATHAQGIPGKLVYADESGHIQIINADGTGRTTLTAGGSILDDDPVYSPDGSKIAFSRTSGFKTEVCVMNADGTNVVTVTSGDVTPSSFNRHPSWSPDGTRFVFMSNRSGFRKAEIWVANADGSGLLRLTTNVQLSSDGQGPIFSSDFDPAWSPDGSKIAFVSNRDGLTDTELYVMNTDGINPVRLTNDGLDDRMPAWSPDSQRIAFSKSNGGGIYIINRDGSNLVSPMPGSWPAWSPDGLRLAVVQLDPNNNFINTIFIAKTDGTDKIKLTNTAAARAPSWAPSSSPPIPTFTISGLVKDTNGVPISGATLTMFTGRLTTTQSSDTGAYSFTGLPAGSYRIDVSKAGYGFVTPFVTLTIVSSDQTANFTGFVAFSISGTVNGGGAGLPVTLSGSESRSVPTEIGGVYSFNVLPAGGNYTVSINSPFFNVTPSSITFNNLSANQVANFDAVIARYTISGTITRLGLPKPGITVQLDDTSGSQPPTTTTDPNGQYAFTNVMAGRRYIVRPVAANYIFQPQTRDFAPLDGNKTADFVARSANNIGFSRATFTVVEGTPSLQISVFRGGNASGVGPITVDYATADGTAKAGLDYTAVSGTLDFPEGSFSRTITIPILDDQVREGSEQFSIILSNPTGEVDLAPISSGVVTIADNEVRLFTASDSDRAIALNTATRVTEPFGLTTEMNFGADHRTRISLFVEDLRVYQTFPTIIIDAVDVQQNHFQLPLEVVAFYSSFPFQELIVRLPANLSTGELFVTVIVNNGSSNTARISISP